MLRIGIPTLSVSLSFRWKMDGNSQMTDPYDMNNWAVGTFKKKQRREKKLKFNIKILVKVRFYFEWRSILSMTQPA